MERRDKVTVEEVQDAIDNILFSARNKTDDSSKPSDNARLFLDSLLSSGIFIIYY